MKILRSFEKFHILKYIIALAGFLIIAGSPIYAEGGATLSLSPAVGTIRNGQTLDVAIKLDTAGEEVTAIDAIITYDVAKLEVVSITQSADFETYPVKSASNGQILVSAIKQAGVQGTPTVATLRLKALASSGTTPLNFVTGTSGLVSSVTRKTPVENILGNVIGGEYTLSAGTTNNNAPNTGVFDSPLRVIFAGLLLCISGGMLVYVKIKY